MPKKKNNLLKKVPETRLTGLALEHWNKIMPALVADEAVNMLDVPIVESACELYARYQLALVDDESGESPLGYIKTYVSIMEKYGATAKARQVMKISTKDETSDKESVQLLKEFKMR